MFFNYSKSRKAFNPTGWLAFLIFANLMGNVAIATDYSVFGADISLSGFATAGFAVSNQDYIYQRFINDEGTFHRDSLIGGQIDIKLNNEFSITAQAKLAHAMNSDDNIEPHLTWAFLSWRPTNDWLFRGGRVRIPLYLNSQNTDIGATFDFARLPAEVYATSPTTDIDGLTATKTWDIFDGELSLEAYVGATGTYSRLSNYNFPPIVEPAYFLPIEINLYGAALTFQGHDHIFRMGVHDAYTHRTDGGKLVVTFPFVSIGSNTGYYQVDENRLPGPGIPEKFQLHSFLYSLGMDISLGNDFRVMGEFVRREFNDTLIGPDSIGGYLAILKAYGNWTPYISIAHLQSTDRTLNLYNQLDNNRVPIFFPDSGLINASQRAAAARIAAFDQTTWALGASYRLTPTSLLKAEWAITDTGNASNFVDPPENESTGNKLIQVFSFSYNVAF